MRVKDPFSPAGDDLVREKVIQLLGSTSAGVVRQLAVEKNQSEMKCVGFRAGQFELPVDLIQVDTFQKLEILRLSQQPPDISTPAIDDLAWTARMKGAHLLTIQQQSNASLPRDDGIHLGDLQDRA